MRQPTYATASWHPLTSHQRQLLARLARQAWNKRTAQPGPTGFTQPQQPAVTFDTWRHEECIRACGRRITEAAQHDFLPLRAHFRDLAGDSGRAFEDLMRSESEPARIALHKLTRECYARKLPLAYPEAICRRQYRCCLAEANAKQLWQLLFTVRNRRPKSGNRRP